MSKNHKKYRFAPKVYGRGVVPISREGWVYTLILVILTVGGAPVILGSESDHEIWRVLLFFIFVSVVAILPLLCIKTRLKGSLKWRRGVKDVDWE